MSDYVDFKRPREDELFAGNEVELESSPAPKRLREDFFLEMLDDDTDPDAGDQDDITSVMRSLEEEIALPPSASPPMPLASSAEQPDLGYLFEASDDELGLPPAVPSSSDDGGENAEAAALAGNPESSVDRGVEFSQIWGFDNEINGYDAFDLEIRPEGEVEVVAGGGCDDDVLFDGGLFDNGDFICGSSDFTELSWRPESLPAV